MSRVLAVAIHDVAPGLLGQVTALRDMVAQAAHGPCALLVVPRHHGCGAWRAGPGRQWLRRMSQTGDEIVLHGYTHLARRMGRDEREMRGRSARDVRARIAEGRDELRAMGLDVEGFIAPCYAQTTHTTDACRELGVAWWATRTSLVSGRGRILVPSIGLGASTRLRRAASPGAARALALALAGAHAVRLDLHPADVAHPHLVRAIRDLLVTLTRGQSRTLVHHGDLAHGIPCH